MTSADILDLFRYNAWANARITSSITSLPPAALTQDLGGSFPTVGSNSRSGTCRLLTDDAAKEQEQYR